MPLPLHDNRASGVPGSTSRSDSHYATLGVAPTADENSIRSRFKLLSLQAHPDKQRRTANGPAQPDLAEVQARWKRIEEAHTVLSDPLTRALYDLHAGFVPDSEETHARIARLKRKDAQRAVATMEETVAAIRAREESVPGGGLLILEARYGDLSVSEAAASRAVSAPYIDVTVPLQYQVSESALTSAPGGASLAWLEGFYDPSMGANPQANRLRVRYKFLGLMHQAEFADNEQIVIPLQEHDIEEQWQEEQAAAAGAAQAASASGRSSFGGAAAAAAAGRSSLAGSCLPGGRLSTVAPSAHLRAAHLARIKARRRLLLYSGLAAVGVGIYLLRSGKLSGSSLSQRVSSFIEEARRFLAQRIGLEAGTPRQAMQQQTQMQATSNAAPAAAASD